MRLAKFSERWTTFEDTPDSLSFLDLLFLQRFIKVTDFLIRFLEL